LLEIENEITGPNYVLIIGSLEHAFDIVTAWLFKMLGSNQLNSRALTSIMLEE
jgi:hypothetical protein